MINLFTDSAANLPTDLIQKHNITVIPFTFTVDGKEFSELDKTYCGKEYYNKLRTGTIVKTSMLNAAIFEEYFEPSLKNNDEVLYIGLSSGVSGTNGAATLTANALRNKYPECKIEIIDSLGASLGEGLLVAEAAEMIENGAKIDDIKEHILNRIPQMCQCFTVESLMHLRRTGRLSSPIALVGEILKIHPLLRGDEHGKIVTYGKVRGFKNALDALAQRFSKIANNMSERIGIAHADNPDGADYLLSKLKSFGFSGKCLTVCYEPMTGAHVGPGTIALFFFGSNRND